MARIELRNRNKFVSHSFVSCPSGFTLVEVMAAIAIIIALVGLSVGAFTYSKNRGIEARTKAEIRALETALENFKLDEGFYPLCANSNRVNGLENSKKLYQALSGNSSGTGLLPDSGKRAYFTGFVEGKNGNLDKDGSVYYIVDPNGNPYNYIKPGFTNAVSFDLWSFGVDAANDSADDIANWKF